MSANQPSPSTLRWPQRLHAVLMPDYNRSATWYWWLATTSGAVLLLWCLRTVVGSPATAVLQIAGGLALAICAGLFPVRIPGTRVSFAAGELCIFTVLLLHGPAAAAVVAAGEAAMGSYRTSKRWTSRLGSPAMATLAMYAAGSLLQAGQTALLQSGLGRPIPLLALAMVIGLLYFLLSATLMGGVARLRRGEHLLRLSDALGAFRWVGLAYAGSAMVSTLLYIVYLQAGFGVFVVTLPLLAMLLLVLHFYYRQQEAQETMRRALAEIAEREAMMQAREVETAARHSRQLQLSERRFHGAFTYASIGMALVELDGRVIQANDALCRFVGSQADALVGTPFAGLLHVDDAPSFSAKLATAHGPAAFEDFDLALRMRCADRAYCRVRMNCSFFRGPAVHGSAQAGIPCLILQVLDV